MFRVYKLSDFLKKNQYSFQNNGSTFFQNPGFLNYHGDRFNNIVFAFYDNSNLITYITINSENSKAISHSGSTYGGFVQKKELSSTECLKIIDLFLKELTTCKFNELIIKFSPEIFIEEKFNKLNNLLKEKLILNYQEETTYINLNNYYPDNLRKSNFKKGHISDIKEFAKQKNFNVRNVNDKTSIGNYYEMLSVNLKKFDKVPTHSFDELYYLVTKFPKNIEISVLETQHKLIAGLTKFKFNEITIHNFYSSMDYSLSNKFRGGLKYLYNYEMTNAKEEGFKFYNFGIDVKHGEKPNKNLRYFKLGFGGLNIKRSNYSAKLKNLKI